MEVFKMNESVTKVLAENMWSIATFSEEDVNVVPVGFKTLADNGTLLVGDIMLDTTIKNVNANGRIAVSAYDPKTSEGYQVKGSAMYFTEGEVLDSMRAAAMEKFNGAVSVKGVIVITPEKVIVTTPGPDNKKEVNN
jgi:uncharacterized protein